jgi:hypothetical protein
VRVALDDLVDVDFIHEYFDELEASLHLLVSNLPLVASNGFYDGLEWPLMASDCLPHQDD